MHSIVIMLLILIVANLGSALLYVFLDDGKNSDRAVKALTLRVALSFALFFIILVGHFFGWISVHPLNRLM